MSFEIVVCETVFVRLRKGDSPLLGVGVLAVENCDPPDGAGAVAAETVLDDGYELFPFIALGGHFDLDEVVRRDGVVDGPKDVVGEAFLSNLHQRLVSVGNAPKVFSLCPAEFGHFAPFSRLQGSIVVRMKFFQ